MNKFLASALISTVLLQSTWVHAYDFTAFATTYPKTVAAHVFSVDGAKDILAAYGVMMLVTLVHELGHAAVAKATCGAPVDIVIGGKRSGKDSFSKRYLGIEFAGFNPLESSARWEEHYEGDDQIYSPTLGQDTAMLLAGPVAQAIAGCCLYQCFKNSNLPIAKAAAIGGIIDTILGINGIYGARYVPWSDSSKIIENIKRYFKSNTKSNTSLT